MSGKELKKILMDEGLKISDVSKMLGYVSDQRLHSALKSNDVKSGLIESIAKATNKSVYFYYRRAASWKSIPDDVAAEPAAEYSAPSTSSVADRALAALETSQRQLTRMIEVVADLSKKIQ